MGTTASRRIEIQKIDHLGIRVANVESALSFYAVLGFGNPYRVPDDAVTIIRNENGIEINLITNGTRQRGGKNILMDVPEKYPGYTHVALRVGSIVKTIKALEAAGIPLSGGPVDFGDGNLSVFIRDPDRNVIELRGRSHEKLSEDQYRPQ